MKIGGTMLVSVSVAMWDLSIEMIYFADYLDRIHNECLQIMALFVCLITNIRHKRG
jgi:NADH:ubiquinone oxidoreductase subunit K